MRKPRFWFHERDSTKICSQRGLTISKVPKINLIPPRIFFWQGSVLQTDWCVRYLSPSELLTSNARSKLCESTFLPTSPLPFPSHPTEVVCGNFQSTGRILEGNSRQKGNSDMCLFSPFAAVCSALEKIPTEGGFFIQIFLTSLSRLVHRIISPPVDKGID